MKRSVYTPFGNAPGLLAHELQASSIAFPLRIDSGGKMIDVEVRRVRPQRSFAIW